MKAFFARHGRRVVAAAAAVLAAVTGGAVVLSPDLQQALLTILNSF